MGKATRLKQQSAREKIAAQRAAQKRAERRRMMLLTGGSTFGVIAVVLVLVLIYTLNKPAISTGSNTGTLLPASVDAAVEHVPATTLDRVGAGAVSSFVGPNAFKPGTGSPLKSGGKPEMLYIGAEFCPYCAATRWSMAVALSRFGTLSPLHGIQSAVHDPAGEPYSDTYTLTFYKSTYSSPYLTFVPVEAETRSRTPLQNPTKAQQAVWNSYETPQNQGFPFIDFGNKWAIEGPLYNPAALGGSQAQGVISPTLLNWSQIAADLKNPTSPVALGVDGEANEITAAICSMDGGKPGTVCSAPTIKTLEAKL